jgi:hypothetical protein
MNGNKSLYLHSYGEVVLGFGWEENIDIFLRKRLISGWRRSHFNDMQLRGNLKIETNRNDGNG